MNNLNRFENSDRLSDILSQNIAKNLQDSIDKTGRASLIVSGGSTPKPLFKKLSKIAIDWEKVNIGLCDERWVDSLHSDSNEKLLREHLLQDKASKARFISMYIEGLKAEDARLTCKENIEANLLPFTVLILGMGSDAHTASLFPNNPKLAEGLDLNSESTCISMQPDDALHVRMSLTRKAILNAQTLYLHFEGKDKYTVYEEALKGDDMLKMPIRSILQQEIKDIEVYCT
ncbi:MAG: 6-phosphogluconolactonase [Campylobacterota bacterium]|nr:6-phosphogluconolactonase [Campylobacterota bacterium]